MLPDAEIKNNNFNNSFGPQFSFLYLLHPCKLWVNRPKFCHQQQKTETASTCNPKNCSFSHVRIHCWDIFVLSHENLFIFPYWAVNSSSQAVGSGRLQQLPSSSLVERDHRPHVVLADRAVDERGDEDSSQALHTVKVRERLVGKVPGNGQEGAPLKTAAEKWTLKIGNLDK